MKLFTLFCFVLAIFSVTGFAEPTSGNLGNLMGFVYGEDGKSPLQDAIVLLKGMETDKVYQSKPTAKTGDYRIKNIEAGAYIVGLKINEKTFNVDGVVKVSAGKTAIISLALEAPSDLGKALLSEQGWCCHDNKVFKSTGEECNKRGGDFFATKKEARAHCGIPLFAFFTVPNGIAIIMTGTGAIAIINKLVEETHPPETSPTQK